jgi:diguanylate cyclase (GGDEF)-like protein
VLALVLGIGLVPLSVGAAVVDHRNDREARQRSLSSESSQQAQAIRNYFERARSLTQVMGRNPAFEDFYRLPGTRRQRILEHGPVVRESEQALSQIEKLFPDSIGEACFIDRAGPENGRAVNGRIERFGKLSPDETQAPFFEPTFRLRPGRVYQARPYLSPDTQEWVIANSTPIRTEAGGANRAIVHFEVTIESFRRTAAAASDRYDVMIVDSRTGRVIVDTRHPQVSGERSQLGSPRDRSFSERAGRFERTGSLEVGGKQGAYERIGSKGDNANDWTVVTLARVQSPSLIEELGMSQVAMLVAALLLLGFAIFSLRASQRELRKAAMTDPLTGLANRRQLMLDLHRGLEAATDSHVMMLLLFDLDGFKAYNDTFGHPAGDALLARLGTRLQSAVAGRGRAYRMGGDEFCVLTDVPLQEQPQLVAAASDALTEHGDGFTISATWGSVGLPEETRDPAEALRISDQRMYARKSSARASAGRQSTDVLLRVLSERNAELGTHLDEVTELCEAVGIEMGLHEERMAPLLQAASLHDVGKAAIPDEILAKADPLTDEEMAFIRRHTLIGERILSAAPALARAATIVRWSHEHYDGNGYPDGLAGEDIPLESRIISVCDAYDAMTSQRPYRATMSHEGAILELQRCSGTQFDSSVVNAFCIVMADRQHAALARR